MFMKTKQKNYLKVLFTVLEHSSCDTHFIANNELNTVLNI